MIRVQTFLDKTIAELLSEYAKENDCSISHAVNNIISAYLTSKGNIAQLQQAHQQHFLRIINVINQIFLCVYDAEKVTVTSNNAQDCLARIKQSLLENLPTP